MDITPDAVASMSSVLVSAADDLGVKGATVFYDADQRVFYVRVKKADYQNAQSNMPYMVTIRERGYTVIVRYTLEHMRNAVEYLPGSADTHKRKSKWWQCW